MAANNIAHDLLNESTADAPISPLLFLKHALAARLAAAQLMLTAGKLALLAWQRSCDYAEVAIHFELVDKHVKGESLHAEAGLE